MNKETWIKLVVALENQIKRDECFSENMGKCFPNAHTANLLPDTGKLYDDIIEALDPSNDGWLGWYLYEDGRVIIENGQEHTMGLEELYNLIYKQ